MTRNRLVALLILLAVPVLPGAALHVAGLSPVWAADFRLDGPAIELRRIQFCEACDRPLMVTSVQEGAAIRCPHCDAMQRRLPTRLLLVKVFQICPKCGSRLDASGLKSGTQIRCGQCGLYQVILPEAVPLDLGGGTGRKPGAVAVPPTPYPKTPGRYTSDDAEPVRVPGLTAPQETPRSSSEAGLPPPPNTREPSFLSAPSDEGQMKTEEPKPTSKPTSDAGQAGQTAAPASAPELPDDPRVEAVVNGHPILQGDLAEMLALAMAEARMQLGRSAATPAGKSLLQKREVELREKILDVLIGRELILQAAQAEGVEIAPSDILDEADALRKHSPDLDAASAMRQAKINRVIGRMRELHAGKPSVSPAQARDYYHEHEKEYLQPARAALRCLVIYEDRSGKDDVRTAQAIALDVRRKLDDGAMFEQAVFRYSEDAFARSGGLLPGDKDGLVPVAALASDLQDKVLNARESDVVGPVALGSSLALIRVERLQEAKPLPFSDVSDLIQKHLQEQSAARQFDQWVESLRLKARIARR